MKISYIEPVGENKKRFERIFGCSYTNYPFPNVYVLIILALLEKKHEVVYNQDFLDFKKEDQFKKFVAKDKSDVYLIFSVNLSMEKDIDFAKKASRFDDNKKFIFLGPAPTFFPEKFLVKENFYAVMGEPDLTVPELVEAIAGGKSPERIKGLSWLKKGEIIRNESRPIIENLDKLPFPARHLIKKNAFYNPKLGLKPFTAMLAARGCPHRCIYCVPCALSFARELEFKKKSGCLKPPIRVRSAANVIEEFKILKSQGYRSISIIDDQFVLGKERILEICAGIKDLNFAWGCLSRVDHLDEEIVKVLSEAGCRYVDIGVESFVQKILDYTKKDVTVEKLVEGIKLLKKHKIFVKLNILFGASPLETKETIAATLKKIREIKPDQVMFDVCSPFPGTEFYDIAKKENWIVGGEYKPIDVARSAHISYPHLSDKELKKVVHRANLRFFFSPRFIFKNVMRLKNPIYIAEAIRASLKKLFQ